MHSQSCFAFQSFRWCRILSFDVSGKKPGGGALLLIGRIALAGIFLWCVYGKLQPRLA